MYVNNFSQPKASVKHTLYIKDVPKRHTKNFQPKISAKCVFQLKGNLPRRQNIQPKNSVSVNSFIQPKASAKHPMFMKNAQNKNNQNTWSKTPAPCDLLKKENRPNTQKNVQSNEL